MRRTGLTFFVVIRFLVRPRAGDDRAVLSEQLDVVNLDDGFGELIDVEQPVPVGVDAFEESVPGKGGSEDVVLRGRREFRGATTGGVRNSSEWGALERRMGSDGRAS